jgi:predicted metalloprotease with PDZ domain
VLYNAPQEWGSARRGTDFYAEGDLIWLEVDTLIRKQTQGKRSLNDFCRSFHGGPSGPPTLKPYKLEDVINGLNAIAPYDWRGLLAARLNSTEPHAPLGGIENAGWKLVYTDQPNDNQSAAESVYRVVNCTFTLGLSLKDDGTVQDVIAGLPAAQAGLGPGMKLIAVNGRRYSADLLREAIKGSKGSTEPLELLAENGEFYKTYRLDYHGGPRYPHLERDATRPDLLTDILKPLTTDATVAH